MFKFYILCVLLFQQAYSQCLAPELGGIKCNNYTRLVTDDLSRVAGGNYDPLKCFEPPWLSTAYIVNVQLALRALDCSSLLPSSVCPNHWAVLLTLSNGEWVNVQYGDCGAKLNARSTQSEAVFITGGDKSMRVRTSEYGKPKVSFERWFNFEAFYKGIVSEYNADDYGLVTDNCQHFARRVIEAMTGKVVGVWPLENGPVYSNAEVMRLEQYGVSSLAMSSTGDLIAASGEQRVINVWDTRNGKLKISLTGGIRAYAFGYLSNGNLVANVGDAIYIANSSFHAIKTILPRFEGGFSVNEEAMCILDDLIVIGLNTFGNGIVDIYNGIDGTLEHSLDSDQYSNLFLANGVLSVTLLRKGRLAVAYRSGGLAIWYWESETLKSILDAEHVRYSSLATLSNGDLVGIRSHDSTINVWNMPDDDSDESIKYTFDHQAGLYQSSMLKLVALADGLFASIADNGEIFVWDSNSGKVKKVFRHEYPMNNLVSLANTGQFATSSFSAVHIWKIY